LLCVVAAANESWHYKEPISEFITQDTGIMPVEKAVSRDVIIYKILEEMLSEFEGGRAYIYTYHNGQNYLSNDPVVNHKQRASMDYEVVANGVKEIGLQMQNIPVSLFAKQTEMILAEKVLGISVEETESPAARSLMESIGSSHAAVLPYRDSDGRVVMVVGVDWVMQSEIFFPEERFRRYIKEIGDIFMGYTGTTNMFNLRNNITRGIQYEAVLLDTTTYQTKEDEYYHFLSGSKELPKSRFSVSLNGN
jgi:hypothetical protein